MALANKTKQNNRQEKGVTLIEVLMVLVFLNLGLLPIFGVIDSSIKLTQRIENNLIAANLAQEGLEITRAIRDASWMNNEPFDQNLPDGDYLVSYDSQIPASYTPGVHLLRNTNGAYNYSAGQRTPFERKIHVEKIPGACGCELKVISEVSWIEREINKVVSIEGHLFNWR